MIRADWRRIAPVLFCLILLLACGGPAAAAEGVRRGPAWPWVSDLSMPALSPGREREHSDGMAFLIADRQARAEPGGDTTYRRTAYQIIDRSGLEEGASLTIDFEPSRETLVLHHARLTRGGTVRDLLATARIQVISKEDELDNGIVTGMKTARIEFQDVRVGDVVDYGYSWISRDPLTPSDVFVSQNLSWSVPVAVSRFRLLWPAGSTPNIVRYAGAGAPTVTSAGGWNTYEWLAKDPEPTPEEKDIPDGLVVDPQVEISAFSRWSQVVDIALPLYAGHQAPAAWRGEIARIAALPDPNRRITEAIRLVQDKLRYVSLSIGPGAYKPRSPDAVVASGYGDCKDKALLLSLVLRALGVDATPALTDFDAGPGLPKSAPSMASFDHVIVRIRAGGQTYWVDATGAHEGGVFPNLSGLRYAWALPITAGQRDLEKIPRPEAPSRNSDVLERYTLPEGLKSAVRLEVTSVFTGLEADDVRGGLATRGLAQTEKKYVDFYSEMHPGLTVLRPLQVRDDRDANAITIREAYEIPRKVLEAGGMLAKFSIRGGTIEAYATPAGTPRRAPLWLPWPVNKRHTIVLVTPGKRPPAPPEAHIETDGFKFDAKVTRKGDALTIRYEIQGVADSLPADKVLDHRARVTELNDAVYWYVDLTSNAGGTIGDGGVWLSVAAFLIMTALFVVMVVLAMRLGGPADDGYAADGRYYPVSTTKFVVMWLGTAGLYPYFWLWKNWRWAARHDAAAISPFWRTFFSVVWLHALFERLNIAAGERRLSAALGVVAAVGYVAWLIAWGALDGGGVLPKGLSLMSELSVVFLAPLVIAARRANADRPEIIAANSRYTGLSWAAFGGGAIWWFVVLYGEFA